MSITAFKVEADGHERTGKDFGYVNIMYRYGNKKPFHRPEQCEKWRSCGQMKASMDHLLKVVKWAISS